MKFVYFSRAWETSNQSDFSTELDGKTAFGSANVSVHHDDITKKKIDVIVNGVHDRKFDLSLGEQTLIFIAFFSG